MPNEKVPGLPDYLAPLVEPTPSGVAKLVAAWDGLDTESQILILTELDNGRLPAYLNEKIRTKALDSTNAYVRYLAARRLNLDTEGKKPIRQRIEEDPDPLVRYSLFESEWGGLSGVLDDADGFFALPHEARLATVRLLTGGGEKMAAIIGHAVDHQLEESKVSEIEIFEILSDYVSRTEFKKHYDPYDESYDGWREHFRGRDIESLWHLVPKLPESISHVLIENLPPRAGLSTGIPEDVLKGMNDRQLTTLFGREDIGRDFLSGVALKALRKRVFFDTERGSGVRGAAIHYNFDLDYAEFAAILAKPNTEKKTILGELPYACNLSLCLYEAIHDVLLESDDAGDWLDAEFARNNLERRLGELKGSQRDDQLRDLRLYRVAKQAVPWKPGDDGYPPSWELWFLSEAVVKGDTWGTFMAFSKTWRADSGRTKKLEEYLPRIEEAGEDDIQVDEDAAECSVTYTEFAAILAKPKSEATKLLGHLAFVRNLSLCLYEAILDVLLQSDAGIPFSARDLERRLAELQGWQRDEELRRLRLYRLAKQAVPWKKGARGYPPSGQLEFLSKLVIEGDTWGTFMKFLEALDSWPTKELEKCLPRIEEAGEDYSEQDMPDHNDADVADRIDKKLSAILSALGANREDEEPEGIKLADALEEKVVTAVESLKSEIRALQLTQNRQRLLLFVLIGLLVWVVLRLQRLL